MKVIIFVFHNNFFFWAETRPFDLYFSIALINLEFLLYLKKMYGGGGGVMFFSLKYSNDDEQHTRKVLTLK